MQFWVPRTTVNPGVFIAIFFVIILCVNFFGVKYFGEVEFWLSAFKIITIVGVILFTLVLVCGGGPDHEVKGFKFWNDPGLVHVFYS